MSKEVIVFNVTDAKMAELKDKFSKVTDVSTKDGYEFNRVGLGELVKQRTGLGDYKAKLKAPHLKRNREIDAEYNRLEKELKDLEAPMRAAKEAEDRKKELAKEKKKEAEEAHKVALNKKVNDIKDIAFEYINADSKTIRLGLDSLRDMKFTKAEYGDFKQAAEMSRIDVKTKLEDLFAKAVESEEGAAEREAEQEEARLAQEKLDEENEKTRLENEDTDRKLKIKDLIHQLREAGIAAPNISLEGLERNLTLLTGVVIEEAKYNEFSQDAAEAKNGSMEQISQAIEVKKEAIRVAEKAAKELEEKAEKLRIKDEKKKEKEDKKLQADAIEATLDDIVKTIGDRLQAQFLLDAIIAGDVSNITYEVQ